MVGRFDSGRLRRRVAVAVVMLVPLVAVGAPASPVTASPGSDDPPVINPPVSSPLTTEQALARARQSGTAVPVDSAKTTTDDVVANPDGTLTLSTSVAPTRKRIDGEWRNLDATLHRNPDGSVSPAVTTHQLTLSGGGSGPMATMASAGMSIALSLPMPLPQPILEGDTATYADVLPDVDLAMTASAQGGLSHVFVVHSASAATNPALRQLLLATQAGGVTMSADSTGNIAGKDRTGRTVLTAPAPLMWDSTTVPAARSAAAEASTVDGPGASAQVAPIAVRVTVAGIELTPDAGLLTGADTAFPVYVDPAFTWSSVGAANNGWATLPAEYPSTNYWKDTPDPIGRMQVGDAGIIRSRTFINFPITASTLAGATINTARLDITETRAWSCNPSRVNLYAPAATLKSSNATWSAWDGVSLGGVVDYQDVAHGYNSSCPAAGVSFDVGTAVTAAVNSNKTTQTFVLKADAETDVNGWKEFLETSPRLTITYNHTPNKPAGMTTSPATSCTAATPTAVGDGQVTLYAPVSDPNGGVVGATFNLWKTANPSAILASSNPNLLTFSSGNTAVLVVPVSTLRTAAGGAITQFSWKVRVTDFNRTGDWSATCNFKFDPTRTGPPTVTPPASGAATIGQSITITVNPPPAGTVPSSYLYQLNGGPYGSVAATAGAATITVIPPRFANTLTVTGLSTGGNVGDSAAVTFNAAPAATAVDGDLTGDNITDLVTAGGTHNLASGLWLTAGKKDGQLAPASANIGAYGIGLSTVGRPTDFDGTQIITGRFGGTGLQDVLVYYPSGIKIGAGVVLRGNGDGSPIRADLSGTSETIPPGYLADINNLNPLQLANVGDSSDRGLAYPDLIAISGDATAGYYLNYYLSKGATRAYDFPAQLSTPTPTDGVDWNTWTITTAQTAAGTAMFLWQPTSGNLYLWTGLAYDTDTYTLSYTQHQLSNGWNTGQALTLHAGDIDSDGTPDLWTVGANATATAWLVTNLTTGAGTITTQPTAKILTGTHAWLLNDAADGPVTGTNTAKDSIGTLHATGTGNAAWNTGDLYDPDITLDGTNATLTTGAAVATNTDFTVSAWVKPLATGGTVLSQDGTNTAGFKLWAEPSNSSWRFALAASNTANPAWTIAAAPAGSVKLGAWTHLTASYKPSTGVMDLHINGADAATATHLTPWNATGPFRIGAHRTTASTITGYLNGQTAEVLTYNQVVIYDDGNNATRDFDGDHKPDLLATTPTGVLYLYRGNGAGGFKYGQGAAIGSGFDTFDVLFSPGDFDGDGHTDVIGRNPATGELLLYRGNGAGGWLTNTGASLGTGWNTFDTLFSPGDFNSDGHTDVIGRTSATGDLYLYRGNGTGGWLNTTGTLIGSGFGTYDTLLAPGDFNGDNHPDLIGRTTTGNLLLHRGNGTGGWVTNTGTNIGTGFSGFNILFSPGDFNGDSHPDAIGRDQTTGNLFLHRGNGTGGWISNTGTNIGTGWTGLNIIF